MVRGRMINIRFTTTGMNAAIKAFRRLEQKLDRRMMHEFIKDRMLEIREESYKTESRPNGAKGGYPSSRTPWKELSPVTLKRRQFPGRPILQQTYAKKNKLNAVAGRNRVLIEETADYAGYHEAGSPKTNLPKRRVFPRTEVQEKMVQQQVEEYIARARKAAGL